MVASTSRAFLGSGRMSSQAPTVAMLRRPRAAISSGFSVAMAPLVSSTTAPFTAPASSVKLTA